MHRLKSMVGWMVRGGDQTRAEFAGQSDAIRDLQQQVAEMRVAVDGQIADGERLGAEVRGALSDLSQRLDTIVERLDGIDARVSDHDAAVVSLTRVVAPSTDV